MKRKILFIILGLFLILFGYANLRYVNPSYHLEPVDVKTFELSGLTESNKQDYAVYLKSTPWIKAVSLHPETQTMGLTYCYQTISEDAMQKFLSWNGQMNVSEKTFTTSGPQCPVHGALAMWERVLSFLRIVR